MDDKMEARLGDEVIVAGYEALPDVYEWLIPDAKLTPEGSVAALGDLVQSLPAYGLRQSNARLGPTPPAWTPRCRSSQTSGCRPAGERQLGLPQGRP